MQLDLILFVLCKYEKQTIIEAKMCFLLLMDINTLDISLIKLIVQNSTIFLISKFSFSYVITEVSKEISQSEV